ncbi:hypothetical protein E2L07_11875 [Halalkalibacterium halodurans]|nr:hypothetical protein E2L07_11875 [Halalkalibacterium halodurans]TPE68109.1 hypothetical protein AMD02_015190 [Halalkalibacterium halodurans]
MKMLSKRLGLFLSMMLLSVMIIACGPQADQPGAPVEDEEMMDETPVDETEQEGEVGDEGEVTKLDLEIELEDDEVVDIEFEEEWDETEAKYVAAGESFRGEEARERIDELINTLELTPDMEEDQVIDAVLDYFNLDRENVVEFDMEVAFAGQDRLEIDRDQV